MKDFKLGPFLKTYSIMTLGLLMTAIGWQAFLIPAQITGGGISGLGALIYYATGFPMGISYLIANVFLILLSIKVLGLRFGVQTIFGVVGLSILFYVFEFVFTEPIIKEAFMATVIGAAIAGTGIGIVFSQGGSTGGTDIIAMMIHKYKNISLGRLILYMDVVIISSSYLLFQSVEKLVYGYVEMVITTYVIDLVLEGANQSYQFFIFSKKYEDIAARVSDEVGRGITLFEGQGWHSKQKTKVLMILVRRYESTHVLKIIKETDPTAFISISNVGSVYGEGFDRMKV